MLVSVVSIHSYQVVSFLCPYSPASLNSVERQLCGGHQKHTLVQGLPLFQSDLCHGAGSLCLLSFIGLLFLRIFSVLLLFRDSETIDLIF